MTDAALLDTNIIIDFLAGIPAAEQVVLRYPESAISVITWIEVLAGESPDHEESTRRVLRTFPQISLSGKIANEAAQVRRTARLKLPDAIILATAYVEGRVLLTRNTKDFSPSSSSVRFPYRI